ncbi:MAG: bifunctional aspartate kinase/homoserine dehydrogenase I [Acidobacteriota bacterium]|nr:bifunctional aspartate kinase/homoserine dehydrogenase I [Acidobacteriota bacterium]
MKVLKFGGSSVGSAENIEKVIEIVKNSAERNVCAVVLSAMQGTTDALIDAAKTAERRDDSFRAKIREIENKHFQTLSVLIPNEEQIEILNFLNKNLDELKSICEGVFLLGELTARSLDRIVSFGELFSTRIFAAKLTSLGISNIWQDSRALIRTDSNFTSAAVDFQTTNRQIKDFFARNSNAKLFILPGFIASDAGGATTTLGRGGSDYTAAILAAALDAEVLEIWTDVSGMMTADPRLVRNSKNIQRITYQEAMELSHFGAKVIYPPTIQPVLQKKMPIWIKNTFAPEDFGTLVEAAAESENQIVRGISSIGAISVLSLEGSGMVGVPGFSKRLFDALSRSQINVILITQSSSEHSICVAVEEKFSELAKTTVDAEFAYEIEAGKIEPLKIETGLSILALVGDQMRNHPGISGKMFSALGHNGINIRAIAQGSSERNISAIISTSDVRKAINTLHEEFFSGAKQVNVFLIGVGTVGGKLIEQIQAQTEYLRENLRLNLRVVGIANSRRMIFDEEGVELANLREQFERAPEMNLNDFVKTIVEKNLRNSIFVDATASAEIASIYPKLLEKSVSVVATNKIACSAEFENYLHLKNLAREFNTVFLFETNVGAGLPVINTLNDLLRSGDRVNRIEAVLSGTLNFVFNNYDGSRSFASVVRQAQAEGYTEPDPRLDLSGTDVARKILILAREAGYKLDMSDVENTPFLPAPCFAGSVEDFYVEMERNEAHFRELLDSARRENLSLKYIASFENGKASVGLQQIPPTHNFANLSGKDNAVLYYTNRYSDLPLVVKGAGAGADVTAAGVFADIIRAARV